MRLHVDQLTTPELRRIGRSCRIYLNNKLLPRCIMADEEKGEVLVYCVNEESKMYIDKETGEPATKLLKGVVQIIFKRECENEN